MVRQVQATISRFAMFVPGERVAAAVSGGCDSVALLHSLVELAEKFDVSLGVIHVNHRLRGAESDADEQFVADLAAQLGLSFECARLDAGRAARRMGGNLEQAARRLRYDWFASLLSRGRFDKIATGHTTSDQAETVLFRLLRGSGSAGLAGILPVLDSKIVRPLLDVSRKDVRAYLKSKHAAWREDTTNESLDFQRNRIRHELLPQLERDWNPSLSSVLAHTAEWARGEEEYWAEEIDGLAGRLLEQRTGGVEFEASAIRELPLAAARRLIRRAIEQVCGSLAGIDFEHVERVRALAASPLGRGRADLPGLEIRRSLNRCRVSARAADSGDPVPLDYCLEIAGPGVYALPGASASIRLKILNQAQRNGVYNNTCLNAVDWDKVPRPLYLRNWRAGDRIDPAGRGGSKKLKLLFQQSRVPAWDRVGWPVLAASSGRGTRTETLGRDTVVWTRKFGSSSEFAPNAKSRVVVEISEVERRRNLGNRKRK